MSDDINNQNDIGRCPMKSLISLGSEINTTSDQLRKAVEKVQNNFALTGGLIVKAKEGIVHQGVYWNWLITSDLLLIIEDRKVSSMDRIPREVLIDLIRILPNFLTQVHHAYFDLRKALHEAKNNLEEVDIILGEVCIQCGKTSLGTTYVQEVAGQYPFCPECLLKMSDRGDIVQVDREQKIGSLYIPKGTYVELELVPRLEWSE